MSKIDFSKALDCLAEARSIVITCHTRCDGDSLGSAAGLAQILEAKGKSSEIILPSPFPSRYAFLFSEDPPRVIQDDWREASLEAFDTAVVLDASVRAQLRPQFDFLISAEMQLLVIDHHLTHERIGTANIIDPTASSVGLLIAELAQAWSVDIEPRTADSLFTAMASDTGWFRFPSTDSRTYQQAWQLTQAGAKPAGVYENLHMRANPGRIMLLARALGSLELLCGGRLAYMSLLPQDFQQAQAQPSDTEDLVNEPLRIGSVEVAVMLIEDQPGSVRLSLRSKRQVDVARIAEGFGGGGHSRAAGFQFAGSVSQGKQQIISALSEELSSHI